MKIVSFSLYKMSGIRLYYSWSKTRLPVNLNEILFWTEREDSESGEMSSRDPLGTETFARQLAELILSGITIITWRV